MKIQITDRTLWLNKVNNALQRIKELRASRASTYEPTWLERNFVNKEYYDAIPSSEEWALNDLKLALKSEGTGEIWVEAKELRAIR